MIHETRSTQPAQKAQAEEVFRLNRKLLSAMPANAKAARSLYMKEYRKKHREELNEYQRRYRKKHPEKLREYNKRYTEKHREDLKNRRKQYAATYWEKKANEEE